MKYSDGRKRKRKIGEARKDQSIYSNLGHPFDIRGQEAIFIGKEEKSYCLTRDKSYTIINANTPNIPFGLSTDEALRKRAHEDKHKDAYQSRYECTQREDYFITIINDKGHKRQYSHLMFKRSENAKANV